jgi:3-oxoacyl-[acyl-carrier-protein] synthase III
MKFLSITHALPSAQITNQALLEEIISRSRKHLSLKELKALEEKVLRFFRMSGTETRYHRNIGERALDFAIQAGKKALAKAGLSPEDVDLLIYAGVGRGWVEPATANLFQSELGLKEATCFDVLDACASWLRSVSIAKTFLDQAVHRVVMVLNCEFNFREYANFEMKHVDEIDNSFSAFTIGEAATATILTAGDVSGPGPATHLSFKTWGEKHSLCKIPLPNASDFSTNGSNGMKPMAFFTAPAELLSFTMKKLISHIRDTPVVANRAYDLIIGHAVSQGATEKVVRLLGMDTSRVFETHNRFGNTVSATLPLALSVAEGEGRLTRGMNVLLLMGSAGVTTGLGAFRY